MVKQCSNLAKFTIHDHMIIELESVIPEYDFRMMKYQFFVITLCCCCCCTPLIQYLIFVVLNNFHVATKDQISIPSPQKRTKRSRARS